MANFFPFRDRNQNQSLAARQHGILSGRADGARHGVGRRQILRLVFLPTAPPAGRNVSSASGMVLYDFSRLHVRDLQHGADVARSAAEPLHPPGSAASMAICVGATNSIQPTLPGM